MWKLINKIVRFAKSEIKEPNSMRRYILDQLSEVPSPETIREYMNNHVPYAPGCEVFNLTQHERTEDQLHAGVVDLPESARSNVICSLTFDRIPSRMDLISRAEHIARIAQEHGAKHAMIGGAPFFMAHLETELIARGVNPLYAFSVRESVETPDGNGGVKKTSMFEHRGFVEV